MSIIYFLIKKEHQDWTIYNFERIYLYQYLKELRFLFNKKKIKINDLLEKPLEVSVSRREIIKRQAGNGYVYYCKFCNQSYAVKKKGFGHTKKCETTYDYYTFIFTKKKKNEIMKENIEYQNDEYEEKENDENEEKENDEEYEEEGDEGNEEKENDESEDEEGKYYIKNTNLSEYNVLKSLQGIKIFPKIIKQKVSKKEIKIYMPKYESKKIEYTENMNFVKGYIKSLLLSIKQLNEKKYIHGDIKPDNFLYKNSKEYHLIDFNSVLSTDQNIKSVKVSTFPFIPPETNPLCEWYEKMPYKESDLWSVGIILLFFLCKKCIFNKEICTQQFNQRRNALIEYIYLYGKSNARVIESEKSIIGFRNINNIKIEKKIERKDEDAIDLAKKLLEVDVKKRINVTKALNHSFFKINNKNNIKTFISKKRYNK